MINNNKMNKNNNNGKIGITMYKKEKKDTKLAQMLKKNKLVNNMNKTALKNQKYTITIKKYTFLTELIKILFLNKSITIYIKKTIQIYQKIFLPNLPLNIKKTEIMKQEKAIKITCYMPRFFKNKEIKKEYVIFAAYKLKKALDLFEKIIKNYLKNNFWYADSKNESSMITKEKEFQYFVKNIKTNLKTFNEIYFKLLNLTKNNVTQEKYVKKNQKNKKKQIIAKNDTIYNKNEIIIKQKNLQDHIKLKIKSDISNVSYNKYLILEKNITKTFNKIYNDNYKKKNVKIKNNIVTIKKYYDLFKKNLLTILKTNKINF